MNHIFYLPNVDASTNGISETPQVILNSVTVQNVFFEYFSMFVAMNAASITADNCKFTQLSSKGSVFGYSFNPHFNLQTTNAVYTA